MYEFSIRPRVHNLRIVHTLNSIECVSNYSSWISFERMLGRTCSTRLDLFFCLENLIQLCSIVWINWHFDRKVVLKEKWVHVHLSIEILDTFQDFLIAEHMKSCTHIMEISISSLNHFVVRPIKTPKSADKKCQFLTFKLNQKLSESFYLFFFIQEYQFRGTSLVFGIFW